MLTRQIRRAVCLQSFALNPSWRYTSRRIRPSAPPTSLSISSDSRSWRPKPSVTTTKPLDRRLATAIGDATPLSPDNLDQPFYHLRPLHPSQVVTVPEPPPASAAAPKTKMRTKHGISGDPEEIYPVLDACLRVGKLERARLLIERLELSSEMSPTDRIHLHNRYLRAAVQDLVIDRNLDRADEIHQLYEMQIQAEGLPSTAETLACMLKISLLCSKGKKLERLILRYMGLADYEMTLEVLSFSDILSAEDLTRITEICPPELSRELDSLIGFEEEDLVHEDAYFIKQDVPPADETVIEMDQKGLGLKSLKKALSILVSMPQSQDLGTLTYEERRELQSRLERDSLDAAIENWRESNEAHMKHGYTDPTSSLGPFLAQWHLDLEASIREEIKENDAAEVAEDRTAAQRERCRYGPLLKQSTPTRFAAITIIGILNALTIRGLDRGMPIVIILDHVGRILEEDVRDMVWRADHSKKNAHGRRLLSEVLRQHKAREKASAENAETPATSPDLATPDLGTSKGKRTTKSKAKTKKAKGKSTPVPPLDPPAADSQPANATSASSTQAKPSLSDIPAWPASLRYKVASVVLQLFLRCAKIKVVREDPRTKEFVSQWQPALTQGWMYQRGKKVGVLMANPDFVSMMVREPRPELLVKQLPMVIPPEPWSTFTKGGYLESPGKFVRTKRGELDQALYAEAAIQRGDMDQMFKGVDILGRTAWRVNQSVLNVMVTAWNTGDAIADIPALNPHFAAPEEPEAGADPFKRTKWIQEIKRIENERQGLRSQRCFINYQLEIARAYRDHVIYFPHNVDFRGRAYPIPPYFNHMGADHTRSLLMFAKGKKLGDNGLKWLKVHLANVYGYDKASLKEREEFATNNLPNIIDSATSPLDGSRWWLKGEDPWQTLATCFELKAAHEHADPTEHVSHLPIHQDGTCNGLQHYAALGGDTWGARQVNLEPSDRPADVYTAVADLVKADIDKDAAKGSEIAKALVGKVTRKVVKQTVMTNVYGVTFAGARKQVMKQLDDLYPNLSKDTGILVPLFGTYISRLIFSALGTMFKGAHEIQYWLGECANRVCLSVSPEQLKNLDGEGSAAKSSGTLTREIPKSVREILRSTIVWTTPLRLPVAQPYRKPTQTTIATVLQNVRLDKPDRNDPVNRRKQLQAFPPNFIHSLDATHMLLSALECDQRGLTFAAVHDSFWTHACDVDTMNTILRGAFIRIHEEDVVGRLKAEFDARYQGHLYLAAFPKDSPAFPEVSVWRRKHSLSAMEEAHLEIKRQQLLASSDPERQEKGRKMVTPASIVEKLKASEAMDSRKEIASLGDMTATSSVSLEGDATLDTEQYTEEAVGEEAADDAEGCEKGEEESAASEKGYRVEASTRQFKSHVAGTRKSNHAGSTSRLLVWMPMSFPPVPEKGDFDVSRLKDSKYFFS